MNNTENKNIQQEKKALPVYAAMKKEYKPLEKKDTIYLFLTLFASFVMVDFAIFHSFNAGFTAAYFVLFAVTSAYLFKKNDQKPLFSLLCGALSLAGSVTFALYDNLLINSIMFFLVFGLYGFYVLGISVRFLRPRGSFRSLFDLFESMLIEPFAGVEDVFGSAKVTSKNNRAFINYLIGFAIAVPFLAVIIPLLMKSDAAFQGLVEKLVKNIGIYLLELAIAFVATPFVFSYFFSKKKDVKRESIIEDKNIRFLNSTVTVSLLCTVALTYVVYLFSQLAYFFSAFKGILPEDYHYTASAFARRGFYEMFAICALNVVLISVSGAVTKREKGRLSPAIKILSLFISLFSVLLIVISAQKMRLNISIYGLSVNRVLVSTLMLMIFVALSFFILLIFAPKISYLQPIVIICSVLFVALSFANIDARCADYNIKAYQSGKIETLDTVTIRRSSDSAIPYLIDLAKGGDKVLSNNAKNQLVMFVKNNPEIEFTTGNKVKLDGKRGDFRDFNLARKTTMTGVRDYINSLDGEEKKPVDKMLAMYSNYSYIDDEDCFYDYSNDEYELSYHYNPKTGNYDKAVKKSW